MSESDGLGAAFDHDAAAGATICSQCQAGAYSSGAGMDASVAEKSSEDDKATIGICWWVQ